MTSSLLFIAKQLSQQQIPKDMLPQIPKLKPHYFYLSILVSSGQLCETNKQKKQALSKYLLRRSHSKVSKKQPWLSQDSPVNQLWEKSILNQLKPIFNSDYSEINLFPSLIIHREQRKYLDSHRLQGQTGNYSWKMKWFVPFCSGTFRRYGL